MPVQIHDVCVAGESAHQHHERALGQVEVGDQQLHHLEAKARGDEDVGFARGLAAAGPGFERAHRGGAYGHDAAAALAAALQRRQRVRRHLVPLAVHAVFGQVLRLDGLEGARAHVQRDAGALHATRSQRAEHPFVKVQRGRGRGHGAGCAGEDGLVALVVLGFVGVVAAVLLAFDVGRQRQVAVALHQLPRRLAGGPVQGEAKQRAVGIGPTRQQRGVEAAARRAARHVHRGAGQRLLADLHVRHDVIAGEHALDEQLQLAATGLLAEHARLDHARVVEHQQVAGLQQCGQLAEDAVHRRGRATVQQARATALGRGVLGDELLGQHEVEVAEGVHAGRGRKKAPNSRKLRTHQKGAARWHGIC